MVANLHAIQLDLFHYFEVFRREEGMLHGQKTIFRTLHKKNQRDKGTQREEKDK